MRLLVLVLGLTVLPAVARAQAILHEEDEPAVVPHDYRSAQHWAFELRLGPYRPNVDDEIGGPVEERPHRVYFGTKQRLMFQTEIDYQFFRKFGSAAVSLQAGYLREKGKALTEDTNQPSNDATSLTLWPIGLGVVYRMDEAARRWNVPLVPYGKVGLNYTLWSIENGNGDTAHSPLGGTGRGGTPGWYVAGGVAFLLDILDTGASRALDSDIGVNHTYIFVEGAHYEATGLGRKNVLHVGDTTWFAGLLFEF
jgi:hypothetical protein